MRINGYNRQNKYIVIYNRYNIIYKYQDWKGSLYTRYIEKMYTFVLGLTNNEIRESMN